jgi:aerobic-type carbon monoxide dehydrogenase small subunit (CoxS/CutS family)
LLWALRDELGLTGTHYGCGIGQCGSCSVLIDGTPTRSCQTPSELATGTSIVTIEGLAKPVNNASGRVASLQEAESLHHLQRAFLEFPLQCMWCLPGHLMSGVALLAANPSPTTSDIEVAIANNLCRCGGYNQIRKAFARAAALLQSSATGETDGAVQ